VNKKIFTTHYSPDFLFKYKIKTSKDKKTPLFWFLGSKYLLTYFFGQSAEVIKPYLVIQCCRTLKFLSFRQDAYDFKIRCKPLFIKALCCSTFDAGCSMLVENQVSSIGAAFVEPFMVYRTV